MVAALIIKGCSNREIAAQLYIAEARSGIISACCIPS
ncbi:hypothetical protein [Paenibacillus agaridevorans]